MRVHVALHPSFNQFWYFLREESSVIRCKGFFCSAEAAHLKCLNFSGFLCLFCVCQWNILLLLWRHAAILKEIMRLQCVRVPHQVRKLSFLLSCGQLRDPTDFWVSGRQQKKLTPRSDCPWYVEFIFFLHLDAAG